MNTRYILLFSFLMFAVLGQAQKFGHMNSSLLLLELQDVKDADAALVEYQKSLETDFQTQGENFQKEYNALVQKAESGDYSEAQLAKEQATLAQKQEQLQKLQLDSQQKILSKREELYAPIILKVEKAVQEVGKEGQYTMIFDVSMGSILHGQESNDVTSLVKAKLGM